MNLTRGLITFCYTFLLGLVLAMLLPANLAHLRSLQTALLLCLVTGGAGLMWILRGKASRSKTVSAFSILILMALFMGYVRHLSAYTRPDMKLGDIYLEGAQVRYHRLSSPQEASRLRLRKLQADGEVVVQIEGRVQGRVAVLDEQGRPAMDAEGRWRFKRFEQAVISEPITIPAEAPAGAEFVVDHPFSKIEHVRVLSGEGHAHLRVSRISNHISSFNRANRFQVPCTILGRITHDPQVYDFKTVLTLSPKYIQYRPGGLFYPVEGGDIRVVLKPEHTGYDQLADSDAYGMDVVVHGSLFGPQGPSNPGGFDQKKFLANHNIYGMIVGYEPPGSRPPVEVVGPAGGPPRTGSPLVEFSLDVRDRMLLVIKQTLPQPQSAFLGAVTLGLRYGLYGTPCIFNRYFRAGKGLPFLPHTCEKRIANEFRASGINHVLAVSGLHVTILTILFMSIFSLLRIPKKIYVPVILCILVIFAVITGARPSTLRAVIMNGLFLLTWGYLGTGLRASVLLGVPVAAFLILLHNPLMIVDPSFTLSFGAILSLALLTGPCYELLSKLRGNRFAVALLLLAVVISTLVTRWELLVSPAFLLLLLLLFTGLFYGAHKLEQRGVRLLGKYGFSDLPAGPGAFIAAQFGIQLGMMIPLSAFYFQRWAVGGAFANLFAIPLIGVVVQVGVLAGLLGMIPGFGLWPALVLNAANYIFSGAFLWIGHFTAAWFPYPFVPRPTVVELLIYYVFIAWFVAYAAVWKGLQKLAARMGWSHPKGTLGLALVGAFVLLLPVWIPKLMPNPDAGQLKVTVLEAGFGGAVLIEAPTGEHILIDGGRVEHERGLFNTAERVVMPYLSHRGIRKLDAVIMTSPRADRSAGLSYVLKHVRCRRFIAPESMAFALGHESVTAADFTDRLSMDASDAQLTCSELVHNEEVQERWTLRKALRARAPGFWNHLAGTTCTVETAGTGDRMFARSVNGRDFYIDVLSEQDGNMVLRVVYGATAMLLTSDAPLDQLAMLTSNPKANLLADVVFAPRRGVVEDPTRQRSVNDLQFFLERSLGALLERSGASYLLFQYGNPGPVYQAQTRDAERLFGLVYDWAARHPDVQRIRTDRDLAIFMASDGQSMTLSTQADRLLAVGDSGSEASSSMEVGL